MDIQAARAKLVEELRAEITDERVLAAMLKVPRERFVPMEEQHLAYENIPLPIGLDQTISQPLVVAFMLEKLEPKEGDNILDVGSGSGWTSALLAEIVGKKRQVIALEIIPELKEFGENNVARYGFLEKGIVKFILGDGSKGYKKEAPYDKILASASAGKIPEAWKEQLKVGGRIVAPIGNSIWLFVKKTNSEFEEFEYPGFVFVPLIEK